jgi:hypothetical protein
MGPAPGDGRGGLVDRAPPRPGGALNSHSQFSKSSPTHPHHRGRLARRMPRDVSFVRSNPIRRLPSWKSPSRAGERERLDGTAFTPFVDLSPREARSPPRQASHSPPGWDLSPREAEGGLREARCSPCGAEGSPHRAGSSPREANGSPPRGDHTPRQATLSPREAGTHPGEANLSPPGANGSPLSGPLLRDRQHFFSDILDARSLSFVNLPGAYGFRFKSAVLRLDGGGGPGSLKIDVPPAAAGPPHVGGPPIERAPRLSGPDGARVLPASVEGL